MKHLFFALLFASPAAASERPSNVAELFQTPENLEIVASPERIDVCMLYVRDPWFGRDLGKRKYKEGKYKVMPPEAAALMISRLKDESTYEWDSAKACYPTYNARVRFHRGGHYVSADLCFGCDIVLFARDGKPFSGEDFDAASTEIFEVIRSLFPKDRVVREILQMQEVRKAQADEERSRASQRVEATSGTRPEI